MTPSLLLVIVFSTFSLGSAADECTGGDPSSVLVVPSSGPTVCLPLDDYIQLQTNAASDGESTNAPPPTSAVPSTQGVSSSALLLYRYMSPLWLQTHANFTETPSSVSARTIQFGNGSAQGHALFRVNLIEAEVLDDDKSYSIQIACFFTDPGDIDFFLQICDGINCVGLYNYNPDLGYAFEGDYSVSSCSGGLSSGRALAPQSTTNWNIRLEIHPNSTSGTIYVSTSSYTYEYSRKLKPSQGLQFRVCRDNDHETYQFHLFELAVYLNE